MKFIFIVQGEGRGHSTQAIALHDMLVKNGHIVCAVLIGQSKRRETPSFFFDKIKAPIIGFQSPNFVLDQQNKGLKVRKSFVVNLLKTNTYIASLKIIDNVVKEHKPDTIINFYDILAGIYSCFYKKKRSFRFVSISHHFLFQHPEFEFPKGHLLDRFLLHLLSNITSAKSDVKLALSFVPMKNIPEQRLYVVPPLLRNEVQKLQSEDLDFVLTYIVNDGYAEEIMAWHEKNTHIKVVCFWDRKESKNHFSPHKNLIFKPLNDGDFLEHLRTCSGYASTAGFESICEAMYLGKPVMMVPTANHFEQLCNSLDAEKAGAGVRNDDFDISMLTNNSHKHKAHTANFRIWADLAEGKILGLILAKQ
jgi:uncharacterized protein (TIGR00661 family)